MRSLVRVKAKQRYSKRGLREADLRELFAEACLHFCGNDEYYGQPFTLENYERENIWRPIFATGKVVNGKFERQYRRALIGLRRGIGKTANAVAMLLAEATMNPVMNGEYGLVADSKDNARKAYQYLASMIRMSPELRQSWKVYTNQVVNRETNAWVRIFPNDVGALQGYHFNMVICDEIHVYRNDDIWQACTSGQGQVPNALALAITTASGKRSGFCWDFYDSIAPNDPRCWMYWVGIDDDDNPLDEKCWSKVMVSDRISIDEMRDQLNSLGERAFTRYILNAFPREKSAESYMKARDVNACTKKDASIDADEFSVVALDGAVSGDTMAVVQYQDTGDVDAFKEWTWSVPDGALGTYDLNDVADVLAEIAATNKNVLFVADPARMSFLANWLERNRGMELFAFPQTPKQMCPASEMLGRSVKNHRSAMKNTPVLAEHCKNAVVSESQAYGRRLSSKRHGQGTERIDAAIAAAMAMKAYDDNIDLHSSKPSGFSIDL